MYSRSETTLPGILLGSLRLETDKSYYSPGETLNGVVHIQLEKSVRIRHLDVQLLGRERVTIDPMIAYTPVASKAHYSSTNEMMSQVLRFLENHVLSAGEMKIPFQFHLPVNALPSYIGRYASVVWKLSAKMDIPWGADLNVTVYLRVWTGGSGTPGPVAVESPGPSPRLSLKLMSNMYQPGESVRGQLTALEPGKLRSVRLQLLQTEDAVARGGLTSAHRTDSRIAGVGVWMKREDLPVGSPAEFELQVPLDATTSYRGAYSMVYWNLMATMDMSLSEDAHLFAPFLVTLKHSTPAQPPTPASQERIPVTVGIGGESLTSAPMPERADVGLHETISAPPTSSGEKEKDAESVILELLNDGGSKDLLTISSELQQSSVGYVDLNRVMKLCEELVSEGKLKRTGTGEYFAQYSLNTQPINPPL